MSSKLTARFCFQFDAGPPTPCRHVDGVRLSIAAPQTKKRLVTDEFGIVMGVQPDVLRLALAPSYPAVAGMSRGRALAVQYDWQHDGFAGLDLVAPQV